MRGILTLARKDFRSLVTTPLFFVVAGLCTTVWTGMYIRVLKMFADLSRRFAMQRGGEGLNLHFEVFVKHISLVNFFLIIAVPALTMRLFAEEKRMNTYDLLLTSPVSATQLVLGKFLAGLGATWALVLISFIYPLSTLYVGDIQWGTLLSSYLGVLALSGGYVAVGIFASSLTPSVMLAVIMALIFNVGLWFLGAGVDISDSTTVTALFEHMSVGTHFLDFIKGNIKISGVVFFLSIMALYAFLTQRVVESSRWR